MPGPLGIVVPLAIALPICTIVAGRRLSLLGISVSVAISQLLFHALFIFGTVPFALQSGHAHHSMPETAMHGERECLDVAAAAAHEHAHFLFADSPAMMIAHAVAAAITALGLYRGEIALAAILRTGRSALGFARAVLVLVPVPEKPDAPSVPIVTRQRRESATTVLLPVHAYRGPPRSIV